MRQAIVTLFMDPALLPGWGLRTVEATDAATLNAYFAMLAEPLSDYTFSQIFTWRNSLRVLWRELHGHLCVRMARATSRSCSHRSAQATPGAR